MLCEALSAKPSMQAPTHSVDAELELAAAEAPERPLVQAQADPATRAIVRTGASRASCAGDDLREFGDQARSPASIAEAFDANQRITRDAMFGSERVIGAVHGHAIGGGFDWLPNCDLVVARRRPGRPRAGDGLGPLRDRWCHLPAAADPGASAGDGSAAPTRHSGWLRSRRRGCRLVQERRAPCGANRL